MRLFTDTIALSGRGSVFPHGSSRCGDLKSLLGLLLMTQSKCSSRSKKKGKETNKGGKREAKKGKGEEGREKEREGKCPYKSVWSCVKTRDHLNLLFVHVLGGHSPPREKKYTHHTSPHTPHHTPRLAHPWQLNDLNVQFVYIQNTCTPSKTH